MKTVYKKIQGKVKRTYRKDCKEGKLCEPVGFFLTLEQCKICNKIL